MFEYVCEYLKINDVEYKEFLSRHSKANVPHGDIEIYEGKAYLGIDCGSTTTKLVLLSENKEIFKRYFGSCLAKYEGCKRRTKPD